MLDQAWQASLSNSVALAEHCFPSLPTSWVTLPTSWVTIKPRQPISHPRARGLSKRQQQPS